MVGTWRTTVVWAARGDVDFVLAHAHGLNQDDVAAEGIENTDGVCCGLREAA